ncbi:MAG: hypothetical protein OXC10_19525 [Rhodospirillaceae bacterium]|nr:hypothetical protein [Rhodospirillaceae bacterium]
MLRVCAALVAAVLVPGIVSAKELKPKFGDIGGVYYTDVSDNREACRQAIKNKIALCRQNTSFVSNTLDRKYPGCLPIFRQQAGICVAHFRRQTSKCDVHGSARIDDFTGFACTVTATVVEEGGEPERGADIAPMGRRLAAHRNGGRRHRIRARAVHGRRGGAGADPAGHRFGGETVAEMHRDGRGRKVLEGDRQPAWLLCVGQPLFSQPDRELGRSLFPGCWRRTGNAKGDAVWQDPRMDGIPASRQDAWTGGLALRQRQMCRSEV